MSHRLLPLTLALAACAPAEQATAPQPPAPTAVRTAAVRREAKAKPIVATGVLAAKAERKASFKLGGIVASITVDEGDLVKRGQVVATLRATEIEAAVEQAGQGVAKAERDLARAAQLFEGNAATREQLDDATTAATIARSQLRAAQFNRDSAVIRALADGRVLRRLAEPSELVAPGQPVLVLTGDNAGWVLRVALADRDVARVVEGTPAKVELAPWSDTPLTASVSEIASAATPLGTYEVELAVRLPAAPQSLSPPMILRSGQIGRARLEPTAAAPVALVPALALCDGRGRHATVWSPTSEGGVRGHRVEVAFFVDDLAAISSGLDGVDEVITDGAPYLSERSRVTVVRTSAATGGAP